MDYPEGFFPERWILALRRQQLLPTDPVQPADSRRKAAWIALGTTFLTPIWIAIWGIGAVKWPGVLLVMCYALAAFALAGVVIGLYRGLRSRKLFIQI
ncbi:MAG: hypothetical protein ACRETB_06535 [Steroidobacteraceae bacterium]